MRIFGHDYTIYGCLTLIYLSSVLSQSFQEELALAPSCSSDCINQATTAAGCAVGDSTCLCDNIDDILGSVGPFIPLGGCIIGACGLRDSILSRRIFEKACDILEPSKTESGTTAEPTAARTTVPTAGTPPETTSSADAGTTSPIDTATIPQVTTSLSSAAASTTLATTAQESIDIPAIIPATSLASSQEATNSVDTTTTLASAPQATSTDNTSTVSSTSSASQSSSIDTASTAAASTFQTSTIAASSSTTSIESSGTSGVSSTIGTTTGTTTGTSAGTQTSADVAATSSSAASPAATKARSGFHPSAGTIAGIVFLIVGFLLFVIVALVLLRRRRRQKKKNPKLKPPKDMVRIYSNDVFFPNDTAMMSGGIGAESPANFGWPVGTPPLHGRNGLGGDGPLGLEFRTGTARLRDGAPGAEEVFDPVAKPPSTLILMPGSSSTLGSVEQETGSTGSILERGRTAGGNGPFFPMRGRAESRSKTVTPPKVGLKALRESGAQFFTQFRPKSEVL